MIVPYDNVFAALWESHKGRSNVFQSAPREYVDALLTFINAKGAENFRFNGLIATPFLPRGGCFAFEQSDHPWHYHYEMDDKVANYVRECEQLGKVATEEQVHKIIEELGSIHAAMYPPLFPIDHPIFFIADTETEGEDPSAETKETLDLYQLYAVETGSRAVNAGKESKAYRDWKALKEGEKSAQVF